MLTTRRLKWFLKLLGKKNKHPKRIMSISKSALLILLTWTSSKPYPTKERQKIESKSRIKRYEPRDNNPERNLNTSSGMCNLTMDKSSVDKIINVTRDSAINVVKLRLFLRSENKNPLLTEVSWAWANKVGREVIAITSKNTLAFPFPDTLTVGTIGVDVHLSCKTKVSLASHSHRVSYVATSLLRNRFAAQATGYHLCYKGRETQSMYTCCTILSNRLQTNCYEYSPFLSSFTDGLVAGAIIFASVPFLILYMTSFQAREYYSINESPLSLSSLAFTIFLEGDGPLKSIFRRLIFMGVYYGIGFNVIESLSDIVFTTALLFWVIIIPFTKSPGPTIVDKKIYFRNLRKVIIDMSLVYSYRTVTTVATLPFNCKFWYNRLNRYFKCRSVCYRNLRLHQAILVLIRECCHYLTGILRSFFVGVITFFTVVFMILSYFHDLTFIVPMLEHFSLIRKGNRWLSLCNIMPMYLIDMVTMYIMFILIIPRLIKITVLLLIGLILNAVYFTPYITSISVLLYYIWTFWSSLELEYFTLKTQIYDICKVRFTPCEVSFDDDVNDGGVSCGPGEDNHDDNMSNGSTVELGKLWGYNEMNVPMLSRQFYDMIREEILPYNVHLFTFFKNTFFVCLYAYFIFIVLEALQTTDISGTVKAISTIGVSAVPHILNTVAAKVNEQQKKAENEVQKLKVEKLVLMVSAESNQVYRAYQNMSDDNSEELVICETSL